MPALRAGCTARAGHHDLEDAPVTPHFVPLNPQVHQGLRLPLSRPYHHAAGMMLCPVGFSEITAVARDYVIAFPVASDGVPQALLGTEAGRNAYLAASGHWLCRYVPAHIRSHPFMVGTATDAGDSGVRRFRVLVHEGAAQFSLTEGEALFEPDGRPTALLERVQASLSRLQADHMATQGMVQQLDARGLLVERPLRVRGQDGRAHALSGFRLLDASKLQALEGSALAELQRSGALMLAYAHLVSLANLHDGVLVQKPALPPSAALSAASNDLAFAFFQEDAIDFSRFN